MPNGEDTIAAMATAPGGAVTILRVSGPEADSLGGRVWQPQHGTLKALPARRLSLGELHDAQGTLLDAECLAVRMPGPHSYTGEDVVELHCHGGALCARLALQALVEAGCRLAEPGEFTRRAFLHGRLDLTQAEAVADVIGAHSAAALRVAGQQLRGRLGEEVARCYETLSDVLAEVESHLDFPEEELELDWRPVAEMTEQVASARQVVQRLLATRRAGEVLRGGLRLAVCGCPNVGKSSLLNRLLGRDRAIVTDIPGTTRDTLEEQFEARGVPVRIIDTAGIRETTDVIERSGMERAQLSAQSADVVVWLFDLTRPYAEQAWPGWTVSGQLLFVGNKLDACPAGCPPKAELPEGTLCLSAHSGAGLEEFLGEIERLSGVTDVSGEIAVAARHAALLAEASAGLSSLLGSDLLASGHWELAALELRRAVLALGRMLGREVEPDVLETIFHRFCIGK